MRRIGAIAWKDLVSRFSRPSELLLMLAAPFVLTLAMGFVAGGFTDSGVGLGTIDVGVVDEDRRELSSAFRDLLTNPEVTGVITMTTLESWDEAKQRVERGDLAAAVLFPEGFSDGLIPDRFTGRTGDLVPAVVYRNPSQPMSAQIAESVLTGFTDQVRVQITAARVGMAGLARERLIGPADVPELARTIADPGEAGETDTARIDTESEDTEGDAGINPLAYFAPGMAVLFLMFTVVAGARSFIEEREQGTIARMLTTPMRPPGVVAGKMLGIFATAVVQLGILVTACALLFGLDWGAPWTVAILIAATACGATGWGMLVAVLARSPSQAMSVGSAVMLIFGILGGTFIPVSQFPSILVMIAKVSPNFWAIDGFAGLAVDSRFAGVATHLVALTVMGISLLLASSMILVARRTSLIRSIG